MRIFRKGRWLVLLVLIALPFLIWAKIGGAHHTRVDIDENKFGVVKRSDLIQNVTVAGTVIPFKRTMYTPPYNAYVKKIFVELGQQVKEGDPIISLEQSLNGVHEVVYPMRAPFNGTVVQILHGEGEYVETAKDTSNLIRIDDLTRLFVSATVPETDVDKIKIGLKVVVKATSLPDRVYNGVIREIFLAAVEKPQGYNHSGDRVEFQIKLEITDKDALLKPGMTTILDVITDKRHQVLTLPHEYILEEKDKYFVTLEDGTKKPIKVGLQNDEVFEITEGVKEGDRVRMVDFASLPKES